MDFDIECPQCPSEGIIDAIRNTSLFSSQQREEINYLVKTMQNLLQCAMVENSRCQSSKAPRCFGVSFLIKLEPAGLWLYLKETPAKFFPLNFAKLLKSTYFEDSLRTAASIYASSQSHPLPHRQLPRTSKYSRNVGGNEL